MGLIQLKKIVVIGSLNLDYVVNVRHMPAVGETILSDKFSVFPGGKGANQAFALGRMGADVTLLGMVGRDGDGDIEIDSLRRVGVDVSHIGRVDGKTGMALIVVNEQGNNSIIVVQGANLLVSRDYIDIKRECIRASEMVILQLEIPLKIVSHAVNTAKEMGKTVILDPAPATGPLPKELLEKVDILKPNEIELAALTGVSNIKANLKEACGILLSKGVGCVMASLGQDGIYVAARDGKERIFSCEPATAVDTTAAGDSFTAAVAFAISQGRDIFEAAQFANRIAAIVVTRKGAQSSMPTREEVERIWAII